MIRALNLSVEVGESDINIKMVVIMAVEKTPSTGVASYGISEWGSGAGGAQVGSTKGRRETF